MRIKRIFHHFEKCEEFKTNMWRMVPVSQREELQEYSRNLMIEHDAFEQVCKKVVDEWIFSCEVNLTAKSINHQAWIGHAACALNHNAPEDITRLAWRTLTEEQQNLANLAADNAIAYWKEKHINKLKGEKNA